jgi:hypothetical protein
VTVSLLQVLYLNPPNYQLASKRFPGRCEDVVLSLHIQILYASIGTRTARNARLDLFKKLEMIWKDRNNSTSLNKKMREINSYRILKTRFYDRKIRELPYASEEIYVSNFKFKKKLFTREM